MGYRDLFVFRRAYALAIEIFKLSKSFPHEERFALTDQLRRSSRSVAANIAEGFRRAAYSRAFAQRITDADAEATETQVWIDFAADCGYLTTHKADELRLGYEEVGKILGTVLKDPGRYKPRV